MSSENEEKLGTIKISDEVIAAHAAGAVLATAGVAGLSGGFTDSLTKSILGKESLSKGIKISRSDEGINLDIFISVKFEAKIPAVAWEIQRNVKNAVEEKTQETVKAVNIHVQGVQLPEEEDTNDQN